jgi:hypothetical protein
MRQDSGWDQHKYTQKDDNWRDLQVQNYHGSFQYQGNKYVAKPLFHGFFCELKIKSRACPYYFVLPPGACFRKIHVGRIKTNLMKVFFPSRNFQRGLQAACMPDTPMEEVEEESRKCSITIPCIRHTHPSTHHSSRSTQS